MSSKKIAAVFVHLLTASGVLCTLLALVAISRQSVDVAFLWLGLALFIDAVDGPLARLVDTKKHLPRFSGERLDLIIDYLNYVVLPAFMLVNIPVISGTPGLLAAALVLTTSLYHFSDTSSKTRDGYFVGFPAIWNIVLFYILAFEIDQSPAFVSILALSFLTFVPIRWLHPLRVVRLRLLTILVVCVWTIAAFVIVMSGFRAGLIPQIIMAGAAVYLIGLSFVRTLERSS